MTAVVNKVNHMFTLMKILSQGRELYAQDKALQEELEINERTLRRYLDEVVDNFENILIVEKKRKDLSNRKTTVFRVVDKKKDISNILQFFLQSNTDLSWVLKLLHEQDPSIITDSKENVKRAVENILHENDDVFIFRSPPFELIQNDKQKKIFSTIKRAVQNHEYANISYFYDKEELLENVKCLKMVYMHNNWYLAVEDNKEQFRFLRMAFIQTIGYANKVTYQPIKVTRYKQFFQEFQNAFSLPYEKQKTAYLQTSSKIAKYFKQDMKTFFTSQKFIKENSDNSIEFSIKYSQSIEILPFIKQWLPDITILEPESLKSELKKDLDSALKDYLK